MKQNSKIKVAIGCATLLLVVLFVFCFSTNGALAAEKKVFNWKFAHFVPSTSKGLGAFEKWFAREIEKRSNGQIKIEHYWSKELAGAKQMMMAVKNRVADLVSHFASYTPSQTPFMAMPMLPFLAPHSVDHVLITYTRLAKECKPFIDELNKYNCILAGAYVNEGYNMMGKKPVRTVDDLKGVRIRTLPNLAQVLKQFGASPMSVPVTEMYSALSTGIVDVISHDRLSFNTYKIDEISKYMTLDMNMNGVTTTQILSKGAWNELPDNLKKVIKTVKDDCPAFCSDLSQHPVRNEAAKKVIQKRGIEVIHFPMSERAKLIAKAEDVWEDWAKRTGNYDAAKEALAQYKRIRDEIVAKYPQGVPYIHYNPLAEKLF